jgi:tight adherence protein C
MAEATTAATSDWALYIIIGIVVVIGIAVALVYVGQRMGGGNEDPLQARLSEFTQRGESITLEDIEMSQPFQERVVVPILKRFGDLATRFTPQNQIQQISRKLELSGKAGQIDPPMFMASKFAVAVVAALLTIVIAVFVSNKPVSQAILFAMIAIVVGYFFPELWLSQEITKRQEEVRKAMPDALDLLTICVEAGLGFDAAMSNVAEKWENELSLAFGRAIREVQLGKLRREALRAMADRIDISEMTSFVAAVIQSEALGVSMAKVLRIQSEQMRMLRRQRAEEKAHQAPVKMLFPMIFFIFPSIFIVLMTPAVLQMMNSPMFGQ